MAARIRVLRSFVTFLPLLGLLDAAALNNAALNPGPVSNIMLAETYECRDDVANLCGKFTLKKNNFAVLDCLQSDLELDERVSPQCQNLVWHYKLNLTKDDRFESAGSSMCKKVIAQFPECNNLAEGQGQRIPCLLEHIDNVTDAGCHQFLTKMAKIIFSDYSLIYHFAEHCHEDIQRLQCGRLDNEPKEKLHNQGKTLVCLAEKIGNLAKECKKQVLRVAELQSDDYHLDRPLFYACRDAREHFCDKVHAGDGKVYKCLYKHKNEKDMPAECKRLLTKRQQLIAQDVKIEKSFFEACEKEMKEHGCLKKGPTYDDGNAARSTVLLCLENVMANDKRLSGECVAEMSAMRRELMEDYQITPEIVSRCDLEIAGICAGLERGGKTIHCLMEHANQRNFKGEKGLRDQCKRALETLLAEANVGEDFAVDRVLAEACAPVLENECQTAGKSGTINCLMSKVESDHMTDDCEDRLLEIQYFIVRDFKLDNELFKYCHKDAMTHCNAPEDWFEVDKQTASNSPMVFPCLYRAMKAEDSTLSRGCSQQIKRTMRRRAKSIDLEPEIEKNCLADLGFHCSDLQHYGKGMEMACLQDNYEDLGDDCQEAVKEFTEDEDKDLDLDTVLMKACTPMIKKFCGELLEHDAEAAEVMNCLIEYKNNHEMNDQCAAGIEHHQVIQLKDFSFTYAFKEACKADVQEHCKDKKRKIVADTLIYGTPEANRIDPDETAPTGAVSSGSTLFANTSNHVTMRMDIVVCLSQVVRDAILMEEKQKITAPCRKQLQVEVIRRGESIELDSQLKKACGDDIKGFCSGKHPGNAEVIQCLKFHQKSLSGECHKLIFKREQDEAALGADFELFRDCKTMIKTYCSNRMSMDVVDCLRRNMQRDSAFDNKCKAVVMRRVMQQAQDYRLNPSLAKNCKLDIPKFCKSVLDGQPGDNKDNELEGKVINCLKLQFLKKRLSRECHTEIQLLVEEGHQDIDMDPVLMHACQNEIKQFCGKELTQHEDEKRDERLQFIPSTVGDRVEECLEQKMKDGKIGQDTACGREITRLVQEAHIDIHLDPLLNSGCQQDLVRWCQEVDIGEGQKMSCLLSVLEDHPTKMKEQCRELLENRRALWEYAAKSAPAESLSELGDQIMQSNSKVYLLGVLMTIVGLIFIVGMTCGRVTKRAKFHKDK